MLKKIIKTINYYDTILTMEYEGTLLQNLILNSVKMMLF